MSLSWAKVWVSLEQEEPSGMQNTQMADRERVPMCEFTEYLDALGFLYAPSRAPHT